MDHSSVLPHLLIRVQPDRPCIQRVWTRGRLPGAPHDARCPAPARFCKMKTWMCAPEGLFRSSVFTPTPHAVAGVARRGTCRGGPPARRDPAKGCRALVSLTPSASRLLRFCLGSFTTLNSFLGSVLRGEAPALRATRRGGAGTGGESLPWVLTWIFAEIGEPGV